MENKKITVGFPCYQPQPQQWQDLEAFIRDIKSKSNAKFEFIVVDDGSPNWVEPPASLKDSILIFRCGKNAGKGAVLREAVSKMATDSDVFAFIDFDLPYSVEDLLGICAGVLSGAELCIGDRTFLKVGVSQRKSRAVAHRFFRLIVRMLITGGLFDTQCGVKAFRAPVARFIAQKSRLNGFFFDVEWLYIAMRHRLTLRCWPVEVLEAHSSSRLRSFFNLRMVREFFKFISNVLSRSYENEELRAWVLENQKKIQNSVL